MKALRTELKEYFFLLTIMAIISSGCASFPQVYVPEYPGIPKISVQEEFPFYPPTSPKKVVYVSIDGQQDKKTIDNVTVEVSSIKDLSYSEPKESPNTVKIKGPDDKQYIYSLFPAILTLKITNNTDHIVTLGRTAMLTGTIIRLEDKNGSAYPLINTQDEAKRNLAQQIKKAFDDYKEQNSPDIRNEKLCSEYKDIVYGTYATEYWNMVRQIEQVRKMGRWYVQSVNKDGVPYNALPGIYTTSPNEIFIKGEEGVILLQYKNPDAVYKKGCKIIQERIEKTPMTKSVKEIDNLKNIAVEQILSIPSLQNVITSGDYPPINILPGRDAEVLVPFSKKGGEEIKEIFVGIYDLPTKVDAAGIPTKRANFTFEMVAKELQ